jgi:hypothetical protein
MAEVNTETGSLKPKKGLRFKLGISWLVLCLILIIASGGAWGFTLLGLLIVTMFFLGCEKIYKAVVGRD